MVSFLRLLIVAVALLASGAVPLAAAAGARADACCEEEERGDAGGEAPCPDCPPGLACGCCPAAGAAYVAVADVAPAPSTGVVVGTAAAEPTARGHVGDIFHPPRA